MSLGSLVKTLESDVRTGLENGINWVQEVVETHLPNAVAEVKAIADSPVFRAIESAVLSPAEEAIVAEFISKIPSFRSQPAPAQAEQPVPSPDPQPAEQTAA